MEECCNSHGTAGRQPAMPELHSGTEAKKAYFEIKRNTRRHVGHKCHIVGKTTAVAAIITASPIATNLHNSTNVIARQIH